jgi:K+-transporting ATPase KdpF subunit
MYGGRNFHSLDIVCFRRGPSLCGSLQPAESEAEVMIENILLLALVTALLVYLVFALLRPEKF